MASGSARRADAGDGANRGPLASLGGAAEALDRTIHERMRLAIVSALAVSDALDFGELKAACQATDGNLSVHARKLEEAGYVRATKTFQGRRPRTLYRLTPAGRRALERYLEHMEALIRVVRKA